MKRYPLASYYLLAFVIAWIPILVAIGPTGLSEGYRGESVHVSRLTAQSLTVVLAMLAGPFVAGIVVTRVVDGPQGLRDLMSRWRNWHSGGRWYAALLVTPLALLVVLLPLMLISDDFMPGVVDSDGGMRLLILSVSYALVGPAFEETGWAGFAQPRMLKARSLVAAGLILGVIHASWHLLPDYWGSIDTYGAWYVPHFLTWIVAVTALRLLMVRAWSVTACLPLAFLIHGSFTGGWSVLGPLDASPAEAVAWQTMFAIVLCLLVAVVFQRTGALISAAPARRAFTTAQET